VTQKLAVDLVTPTLSSAFDPSTKFVHLAADEDAHFLFGTNPTATAANRIIRAGGSEFLGIAGPNMKISVLGE
jgi:hypothetical protein